MKKKRVTAILLAATMAIGLMAGCGSGDTKNSTSENASASGTEVADSTDEIYECVVQYPTLGQTPEDISKVEDALNKITEEKIGVHVTFYPVSAFDLSNTTNLMVSSGEKLDLAITVFEGGCASYVNKGELLELDELVQEYGQDILKAEGTAMAGGYIDGTLYAIPTEEKMGRVKAFEARKDLLDKYNIPYDPKKVYTPEELTEIFATIQAGEGTAFHCIATSSGEDAIYTFFDHTDQLGADYASGVLMEYGTAATDIVNYFETEEFASLCDEVRGWYQNGYLSQDCNTTTDSALTQMQTGNYLGMFSNAEPDMVSNHSMMMQPYVGSDIVPLYTSEPAAMTQYYQITQWMIPYTCENPEKTMQFLNLLYADKEVINLINKGIEGVHYNFTNGSDCVIEYANGYDASTTPYAAILNVWGDKSKDYVMPPLDETYYDKLADFNASVSRTSKTLGYTFNSQSVKTQRAAVNDVITQYKGVLGLGVTEPKAALSEFIKALKAAGIDEIIAENQTQLDNWLSKQ